MAFHGKDCESVPCLRPYMILQLVLSVLHCALAIVYRVTGLITRAEQLV